MQQWNIDLPVLLIFFARPNTLEEVFEKVRQARPAKLFLACDGPRADHPEDADRISQCKKVVSNIDWECEVFTYFADVNQGCGRGPANAISWAFSHVDKLLILEDDCVPDDTLFPFMKEMLDRYESDSRIGLISGLNHLREWDCGGYSYCFTKTGATLGWGTWKRVWDQYDYYAKNVQNPYYRELLKYAFTDQKVAQRRVSSWMRAAEETPEQKVNYWDVQFGLLKYSHSLLAIVPKHNLIRNIGVGAGSTHTADYQEQPWKKGSILFMPTRPMELPLVHPQCQICDCSYDAQVFRIIYPGKVKKIIRRIKRILRL